MPNKCDPRNSCRLKTTPIEQARQFPEKNKHLCNDCEKPCLEGLGLCPECLVKAMMDITPESCAIEVLKRWAS